MPERLSSYSQKRVRHAILNKTNAAIRKTRAGHETGFIYLDGILITRVKIPNAHVDTMSKGLTKAIANSLLLSNEQFTRFVNCPMGGSEYKRCLRECQGNGSGMGIR